MVYLLKTVIFHGKLLVITRWYQLRSWSGSRIGLGGSPRAIHKKKKGVLVETLQKKIHGFDDPFWGGCLIHPLTNHAAQDAWFFSFWTDSYSRALAIWRAVKLHRFMVCFGRLGRVLMFMAVTLSHDSLGRPGNDLYWADGSRSPKSGQSAGRPHQATNGRETTDHETWKTSEDPFRIVIPKMKSITHNEKNCEETTPTIGQPLRAAWPSSGRHSDAFEKPQLFWLVVSHVFPFFLQKNPHNLKWWSSMTMTNMNQHD